MFAYMSLVPRCFTLASPVSTLSFNQKYLIEMCLVRSAADRPRSIRAIQDMLSWCMVTGPQECPCAMMKLLRCSAWFAESDNATNSASVLDFVTICCFEDLQCTAPLSPITMQLPVCDLPSACTPYAASISTLTTIHFTPGASTIPLSRVAHTYFMSRSSLARSSTVHLVTLVARKATAVRQSGRARFARYSILATCL